MRVFIAAVLAGIILSSASYSQDELETATIKIGDVNLIVEIAATPKAWERGLMHREDLPEGRGMLFVYPKQKRYKLWMKNTLIPLSAAFIKEDGRIAQIVRMEKVKTTKIYRSKEKVKYALEVPLGYFERHGIMVGDSCIIPEILLISQ